MNTGKLIVLSAPSGTGKTSICKEILKRNKDWKFSISATTRELRQGEKDGIDYIFVRVNRTYYDIYLIVEKLDKLSLEKKRQLTLPLIKEIL